MKKSVLASLAITFALALVCVFSFGSKTLALAEETVSDKTVADFTTGSHEGFTLSGGAAISQSGVQLAGEGKISTDADYKSFMAQIIVGDMVKGFTIGFGNGTNRCTLRVDGAAARISATGLKTASGSDTVMLDNYLVSGSIVRIDVVGGAVEVAVKNADEPYDALGNPAATFVYADGISASRGAVELGVFDGAICAVKELNVYSLDPKITIPTEDYVAPEPDEEPDDKFNPLYVIIPCVAAVVVAAGVTIALVAIKRRKHEK